MIISSETRVSAEAKLVDLQRRHPVGGQRHRVERRGNNNSSGGVVGLLLKAVITQIADTLSNRGYPIAGITASRLFLRRPAERHPVRPAFAEVSEGRVRRRLEWSRVTPFRLTRPTSHWR